MSLLFWRKTRDVAPDNAQSVAVTETTPLPVQVFNNEDEDPLRVQVESQDASVSRRSSGSVGALDGFVALDVTGCGTVAVQVTGTWTATLAFEATVDENTWAATYAVVPSTGARVTTTTATGLWLIPCAGLSQVRVRASAYTSGGAAISLGASGGGGSQAPIPLLYAADGTALFAVPPQLDSTDRMAVSLYGKASAAGDTAMLVDTSGNQIVAGKSDTATGVDNASNSPVGWANKDGNILTVWTRSVLYNGSTWDRPRDIAASGAGLGVQQVGTLGELITLAASAARTASANGTAVTGLGWRNRYIILCDLTVAATAVDDTLDVYVDVSLDGNTWVNAVHFTQMLGNGSTKQYIAVLDPSSPGTSPIVVTTDAAEGVVRPSLFGPQMRARWAIVDAGTDDASFTFSVTSYAI